jgi:hypothetical protein
LLLLLMRMGLRLRKGDGTGGEGRVQSRGRLKGEIILLLELAELCLVGELGCESLNRTN